MRLSQEAIQRMISGRSGVGGGGGSFDPSDLAGYATQAWTEENYISKTFFNELFIIHKKVTTVVMDGETEISRTVTTNTVFAPNEIPGTTETTDEETGYVTTVTTEITSIESKKGFWTNYFLSALGLNSEGGGGGLTLNEPLATINVSGLAAHPSTSGQTIVWNGTAWVYGTAGGGTGTVTGVKVGDITYSPVNGIVSIPAYPTSLAWSAITSKPTTIAGYGITDAKIENGVITLGGNTITPLTSFTETDPTVPAWAKQANKPSYSFSEITSKPTTLSGYGITDAKISNGVITLGSDTITPVTSVAMTVPTGFSISGSPISKTGTLGLSYANGYEGFTTELKNKINEIYSWFELDSDGNVKTKDKPNNGGHRGFWTESFVSALGMSDGGGQIVLNEPLNSINNAGLAAHPSSSGQTIVWNGNAWTYGTAGGSGMTYTFATGDANGQFKVTPSSGSAYNVSIKGLAALAYKALLAVSDIPDLSGTYLPLSAGSNKPLTGSLYLSSLSKGIFAPYTVNGSTVNIPLIYDNGENLWIGATQTTGAHHVGATYISAGTGEVYISRLVSGTRTNYKALDKGNTYVSSGKGYIDSSEITTISGNAGTASRLQGSGTYTAWGQTYWQNGVPQNVVGDIRIIPSGGNTNSDSAKIDFRTLAGSDDYIYAPYIQAIYTADYGRKRLSVFQKNNADWTTGHTEVFTIMPNGTVGINPPSTGANTNYKLDVNGYTKTFRLYLSDTIYMEVANNGVHIVGGGLYADTYVSALGISDSGSSGVSSLSDLVDVNISSPSVGQVLKYRVVGGVGEWYNGADEGTSSVTWNNITGKPTTIAGYGITDAKIENGAITLGSSTITPLTQTTGDARYARLTSANNLVYNNNEITVIPTGFVGQGGKLWINYSCGTNSSDANFTAYHMGNGTRGTTNEGYANVTANGFVKNGSSDSYVLLGGGGHKLESGLSVGTASKLSTVSKTAWGRTYWTSGGIPTDVSGDMTGVGSITASGNITTTKENTTDAKVVATNNNGGISLLASANRGIYDVTNSSWLIGTDGTNTFLSDGNVGIGTTAPTTKLDVRGDIRLTSKLYLYKPNSDDTNAVYLKYENNGVHIVGGGLYADTYVSALGLSDSGSSSISALADLTDVSVSSLSDNQGLVYNSSSGKWKNATLFTAMSYSNNILSITVSGVTKTATIQGGSSGVTSVATGTGLTGGTITSTGTISINSTYQDYISHGESAYNSLSSYLPKDGSSSMTGALKVAEGKGIEDATYGGLLCTRPTNWTGVSSSQWGVGELYAQGVLRSNNSNLVHYKSNTAYDILDSSNSYVSSGKGYINGTEITSVSGNAATASRLSGNSSCTAWGQTYWSSGVPSSISGDMTSVGNITASGNIKVVKSSTADIEISTQNTNGKVGLLASANKGFYNFTASRWIVASDQTNSYTLLGGGNNVGIGYTYFDDSGNDVPTYKLVVKGTVYAADGLRIGNAIIKYDEYNNALKVQHYQNGAANFYATGGVSALGMSAGTSGMINANLLPETTGTYNLGSTTNAWRNLYLSDSANYYSMIYMGAEGLTLSASSSSIPVYVQNSLGVGGTNTSYKLYVSGTSYLTGKLSIAGTNSNSDKLYVNGSMRSSGISYASSHNNTSDARLKNIIGYEEVDVETIARAPLIKFTWKDGDSRVHIGTLAQYWIGTELGDVVEQNDYLSMDYATTALAGVISVARKVMTHEERIAALEAENERLRNEIETLKAA